MPEVTNSAWSNAISCVMTDNSLFADLAKSVCNDPSDRDGAARWLLTFICGFLRENRQADNPIAAFDFAWPDIEALADVWPVMQQAADTQPIPARHVLPIAARFVVERMPAVWRDGPDYWTGAPATRAVVIADRADTLVGMFAADVKITGSKDPFALRRAAKDFLRCIMMPCAPLSLRNQAHG